MMKIIYDPDVDILSIVFSQAAIEESDEKKPGIIMDYDQQGNIVGMEIMNASKRMDNPNAVEYMVAKLPSKPLGELLKEFNIE